MTKLIWRVLGRASVLMLAVVLALGTTVPAFANDEDGLERRGFSGVVTVLKEGSITVETDDGESVIVALTGGTQVRLPSGDVQSVMEVELRKGARVAILAEVEADGSLTALWTLVKPERPQVGHLLGTVITMEDNRVTIVDAQGNEHTVEMPEQALQGLQVGDMTTFVIDQTDTDGDDDGDANGDDDDGDANGDDDDELLAAHAAVSATLIQERVAAHATALRERAQARTMPVDDAEERIKFLGELTDIIQQHVHGVLTIVKEKVPGPAKLAIERAMKRAKAGFDMARAAIQRAGPPEGVGPPEGIGPPEGVGPSGGVEPPGGIGPPGDEEPEE